MLVFVPTHICDIPVAGIIIAAIPIYIAIDMTRHFDITLLFIDYFLFITTKFLSVANILYHNVKVYDFYGSLSFFVHVCIETRISVIVNHMDKSWTSFLSSGGIYLSVIAFRK